MEHIPPQLAMFASALLTLLIVRASDIQILCKKGSQRTKREQQRVGRGLMRSFLLEVLLFVPASVGLVFFISPTVIPTIMRDDKMPLYTAYAILGIASYGFPLASMRTILTRIALNTLKEYAEIALKEPASQESE